MIRDYRPADHEPLLDLWQEAWQATLPEIDFAARRPGFSDRLAGMVAGGIRLRVAVDAADAATGFYTLDTTGYLDQVAVARAAQGSGVAHALLDDAKSLSPGDLSLRVNQKNHRAIRFYEREGFQRGAADVSEASGLPLWWYHWPGIGP